MSGAGSVDASLVSRGWRLDRSVRVPVLRCAALEEVAGLCHGFSTAGLDAGEAGTAEAPRLADRRSFLAAVGLEGREAVFPRQVHGARVIEAARFDEVPEVDGIGLLRAAHLPLAVGVRTADCVPVLLADANGDAAAAVHAGWRGTAAGIAAVAVRWLAGNGVPPSRLLAAVGPAVGACCYEVGEDVAAAVLAAADGERSGLVRTGRSGRPHVDLQEAVRRQLEAAGVPGDGIHGAGLCTICGPVPLHSYRRDGAAAGRMMAVAGFAP